MRISLVFACLPFFFRCGNFEEDVCYLDKSSEACDSSPENHVFPHKEKRFLLYDVNPGEGFNLRRDVYMRMATLVKKLNEDSDWTLVLPPWGPLYHWKSRTVGFQTQLKWSRFFDVPTLAQYVPVIEFEDFLKDQCPTLDVVYYLQHYAEGWENNRWEERLHIRECIEPPPYEKAARDRYVGWFWGFQDVAAREFHCVSVQGYSSTLKKFLLPLKAKVVMIDRAEVILHDSFGDAEYWMARKSMIFSKELTDIGDAFRKQYLNSTDEQDETGLRSYDATVTRRSGRGGPYVGVHMRRQDFTHSRSKDVPSVKHAASQILNCMKEQKVDLVFVATDAPETEFKEFKEYVPAAVRFVPSHELHRKILDGGLAIVDQWICAHARYFIGTYESTFSFRIQEERELLGFPVETTFNRLCGDNQTSCKQPSRWTLVQN